jgi:hypothetical protein
MAESEEVATYPCPACGKTLYGWLAARHPVDGSKLVLDRCENCLLVVTRAPEPPDVAAELASLLHGGSSVQVPNRESFQGGIGGAQWAGLEPERRRLHLNPRAAALLFSLLGRELSASRTRFGKRGYLGMVQTLINAFTLRDNFFRNARAGRLPRRTLGERARYGLDAVVSAVVAIPMAIVALPLELVGALVGRGGTLDLELKG